VGDASVDAAGLGGGLQEETGNRGRPGVGSNREITLEGSWGSTLEQAGSGERMGRKASGMRRRHDSKMSQRLAIASTWGYTCGRRHPCEGSGNVLKAMDDSILCGWCRDREVGMVEFNRIGDNLKLGVSVDQFEAAV
jgi:hypothetical protein